MVPLRGGPQGYRVFALTPLRRDGNRLPLRFRGETLAAERFRGFLIPLRIIPISRLEGADGIVVDMVGVRGGWDGINKKE